MQDVNTIPSNCDYFFMRERIEPMWEDPANKGGCELRMMLTKNMDANQMWKNTVRSFDDDDGSYDDYL